MFIYLIDIEDFGYDCYSGHVVVANNEDEVILLAKESAGDEGTNIWEIATITNEGVYSGTNKMPFILLSSYHAS